MTQYVLQVIVIPLGNGERIVTVELPAYAEILAITLSPVNPDKRLGGTIIPARLNVWIEQPVELSPILSTRVQPVKITLVRYQEAIPLHGKFRGMAVYGIDPVAMYSEAS